MNNLKIYEILTIFDHRLSDEELNQLLERYKGVLTSLKCEIQLIDNWGKKRLSFDIKKLREGIYVAFVLKAEPSAIKEFERQLKINEFVLRYMTTLKKDADKVVVSAESTVKEETA